MTIHQYHFARTSFTDANILRKLHLSLGILMLFRMNHGVMSESKLNLSCPESSDLFNNSETLLLFLIETFEGDLSVSYNRHIKLVLN